MRWLAALVCLIGSRSPAAETPKLDEIRARGRLIASVKNQGPASPSLHNDPAHFQKRGFELAIAHAIARQILGDDSKIELKLLPKLARIPAVMNGQVDLAITMLAITDERRAQIDFSEPYYEAGLALLVKAGSRIARVEDLDGRKVAAPKQTVHDHGAELKKLAAAKGVHVTIVELPSFALGAAAVENGKVAALVAPSANIDVFLAQGNARLAKSTGLLNREQYAVAIKKGNGDLLQAVNDTIADLRRTGELERLAAKWQLGADAKR
jgi:aspartate/glutamate/glutamine transport system substrate-binding protein